MQEPSHRKSQQRPKSQARERRLPILARVAGWWICFTGWHFWVEEEDDPNFWWERADTGERMRKFSCLRCSAVRFEKWDKEALRQQKAAKDRQEQQP